MNVLFLSISTIPDVNLHSISLDLIREFQHNGHEVCIVCALEKNSTHPTYASVEEGFRIVRVQIGGNKKANFLEKGITTLTEPSKYVKAIKRYLSDVRFNLILHPTPPITQEKTIEFVKKRDGAISYLLLKDIFPQNSVDLGILSKSGVKGILYGWFRRIEKRLYRNSDFIGCMSQENVEYLLRHNPWIPREKIEVCPNSIEVIDKSMDGERKISFRKKYGIPLEKKAFIYGGNLGKPQGIPFLIRCLKAAADRQDFFFVIVGDGTEYERLRVFFEKEACGNGILIKKLPKEEYDCLAAACDVGLIFLDHRFTIPNFPSRLLSYLQARLPVLACTDPCTDLGKVITEGGFGWWRESNDEEGFLSSLDLAIHADCRKMGDLGFQYLEAHYSVKTQYCTIMKRIGK